MKKLCFLFLALSPTALFGQLTSELLIEATNEIKEVFELESKNFKNQLPTKHSIRNFYEYEFPNGSIQNVWTFNSSTNKKNPSYIPLQILTLSEDGYIFYKEIYNVEFTNEDSWFTTITQQVWVDSLIFRTFKKDFKLIMNDEFSLEKLEKVPISETFGYACGASGSIPELGENMLKMVDNIDIAGLKDWLKSYNTTKQAYGFVGLRLLEAQSLITSDELISINIELVKKNKGKAYYCSGCTIHEFLSVGELLDEVELKIFISNTLNMSNRR